MFGLFKKKPKCLRCKSEKLTILKPTIGQRMRRGIYAAFFPLKNLNVCEDCGFSWEDRA